MQGHDAHTGEAGALDVHVLDLDSDSYGDAAIVLGRAFRDNPPARAFFEGLDGEEREKRLTYAFLLLLKAAERRGWLLQARKGTEVVGVGIIHPPGAYPLPVLTQTAFVVKMILRFGFKGIGRYMMLHHAYEKRHKEHMTKPHYYFEMLGTDRHLQGHGIGSRIFQKVVERADQEGVGVYAESSDPRNDPLCERFGFEVCAREKVVGVPISFMWRPASHGSPESDVC